MAKTSYLGANIAVSTDTFREWINRTKLGISEVKFARELKKYVEQNNLDVIKKAKKIGGRSVMVWFGIRACTDEEGEPF